MVAVIIIVVVVLIGGGVVYYYYTTKLEQKPIACTEEAKICSDGSAVGRIGPNCEFAQCPIVADQTTDWETYTNNIAGYQIEYPPSFVAEISNCFVHKKDGQKLNDEKSLNIGDQEKISVHICYYGGIIDDFSKEDGFISTTIGGRPALKKEFEIRGGGRGWYYIQKDNSNILFIDASWAYSGIYPNTIADEQFNKRKQTIDQMLSTLKLIGNSASNCIDSDASIPNNEYTKGFVEFNGVKHWDECYGVLNHLQEYYCAWDGSNWKISEVDCPKGCSDGACIK